MSKGILAVDFLPRKKGIYTKFTIDYQDIPKLIELLEKALKERNENIYQTGAMHVTNDTLR